MRRLALVCCLLAAPAIAQQEAPRDPVELYVARAQAALALADIRGTGYALADGLKSYYEAAMTGAKNDAQRRAIVMHYGAAKRCVIESPHKYDLSYPESDAERDARVQPCIAQMEERASAIEAAKYAP